MSNSFAALFYLKDKRLDKNGKAGLYLRLTVNGQPWHVSDYFYRPRNASSDHDSYEIGKDAHHGPCDQDKDQHTGDSLFKVGVLPKEVSGIEQEAHQKDDPQDNRKDGPNGIGYIIDRILDAPDLGQKNTR